MTRASRSINAHSRRGVMWEEQHRHTTTTTKEGRFDKTRASLGAEGGRWDRWGATLVARQADDGGAGELLRRDRAAGGRRGVGQVPRRHGLEEPHGRRRACGRAGRRRWRPAGSSRHAQSAARTRRQDAEAGSTSRRREDEQRAKGHRKRTGQRGDDVDEAQRPQRGQAPAREGRVRVSTAL